MTSNILAFVVQWTRTDLCIPSMTSNVITFVGQWTPASLRSWVNELERSYVHRSLTLEVGTLVGQWSRKRNCWYENPHTRRVDKSTSILLNMFIFIACIWRISWPHKLLIIKNMDVMPILSLSLNRIKIYWRSCMHEYGCCCKHSSVSIGKFWIEHSYSQTYDILQHFPWRNSSTNCNNATKGIMFHM